MDSDMHATFTAVPVLRDREGYFQHNDFPVWEEGETVDDIRQWFFSRGCEITVRAMEDEISIADADQRQQVDNYTAIGWEPNTPAGEHWFLASIHPAQDGPCCIWARPISSAESSASTGVVEPECF